MQRVIKNSVGSGMQLTSMTGLGRARIIQSNIAIEIVAKSVNHRNLDVKLRLPNELNLLEADMNAIIGATLSRGRIDVVFHLEIFGKDAFSATIDEARIETLLKKLKSLQEKFAGFVSPLSMGDLLSMPGMVVDQTQSVSDDELKTLTKTVLTDALKDLMKSRQQEGVLLATSLSSMIITCDSLIDSIIKTTDSDVARRMARFKARTDELFNTYNVSEDRLYQEFALLCERSDFKEEIDRLKAHIEHFNAICQKSGAKGRKLDFLCQEMLRECNTLLSKAFEHTVVVKAVDLKAEIERVREQIQNIE